MSAVPPAPKPTPERAPAPERAPGSVAALVAGAFGLGDRVEEWRPVAGGLSHRLFRLRTERGAWAVKWLNRSREEWWLRDHRLAVAVERAALAAGVPMPRPVLPATAAPDPFVDLPVDGEPVSFLVWEWCDGERLDATAVPGTVRRWVGSTLAALHTLPVAPPAGGANVHPPQPVEEWRDWLESAPKETDPDFLRAVATHLPTVAEAHRLLDAGTDQLTDAPRVFTHRDVKPDNVLVTARTPVLLDWEGAGQELARWETARAALDFSRTPDGRSRVGFTEVVAAYRAAGGDELPPEPATFGGLLDMRLGGAAFLLWRALGHRPVTAPERAAAHGHTLAYLDELAAALDHLPTWCGWLRDVR
ncbi:phosphotransferase family protein [Streptomyces triticirhizae]|uniref:phosphotransferase family protein n=1 Tax=Streptomyces triticirhizae TaxID=2483353 RepID=UPI001315A0D8|nr:aminoglycoside phosphotransferase family protein [Streptomyces triticirhizae]